MEQFIVEHVNDLRLFILGLFVAYFVIGFVFSRIKMHYQYPDLKDELRDVEHKQANVKCTKHYIVYGSCIRKAIPYSDIKKVYIAPCDFYWHKNGTGIHIETVDGKHVIILQQSGLYEENQKTRFYDYPAVISLINKRKNHYSF